MTEDRRFFCYRHLCAVIRIITVGQHLCYRFATIIHIKGNGISCDVSHRDAINKYILHDTATATG